MDFKILDNVLEQRVTQIRHDLKNYGATEMFRIVLMGNNHAIAEMTLLLSYLEWFNALKVCVQPMEEYDIDGFKYLIPQKANRKESNHNG